MEKCGNKIKNICSYEPVVKNPFCLKVNGTQNKMFNIDNSKRETIGNTKYIKPIFLNKDEMILENQIDNKLSYTISTKPKEANGIPEEITPLDKLDYQIPAKILNEAREKEDKKPIHKEGIPMSFMLIDNEEDGLIWYRNHYPKIPEELLPIIARYHWGHAINKHTLKKEKKQINSERIKNVKKAEIQFGEFVVDFP